MALHRAGQADARHGFVESFSGRMRDEFLNETLLRNLAHARDLIATWVTTTTPHRPIQPAATRPPQGWTCT
jgi:hypothetical protein